MLKKLLPLLLFVCSIHCAAAREDRNNTNPFVVVPPPPVPQPVQRGEPAKRAISKPAPKPETEAPRVDPTTAAQSDNYMAEAAVERLREALAGAQDNLDGAKNVQAPEDKIQELTFLRDSIKKQYDRARAKASPQLAAPAPKKEQSGQLPETAPGDNRFCANLYGSNLITLTIYQTIAKAVSETLDNDALVAAETNKRYHEERSSVRARIYARENIPYNPTIPTWPEPQSVRQRDIIALAKAANNVEAAEMRLRYAADDYFKLEKKTSDKYRAFQLTPAERAAILKMREIKSSGITPPDVSSGTTPVENTTVPGLGKTEDLPDVSKRPPDYPENPFGN